MNPTFGEVVSQYKAHFGEGKAPYIYTYAPGRMNFIGEHVDYLGGCVVPAALEFATQCLMSAEPCNKWTFSFSSDAVDNGKVVTFTLDDKDKMQVNKSFFTIMFGCVLSTWEYCKVNESPAVKDHPLHIKCEVIGRVPVGAGVSSSAALCVSVCNALAQFFDPSSAEFHASHPSNAAKLEELNKWKKGLLLCARSVECLHCGVNCGVMDQYASIFGAPGTVLRIDCDALEHQNVNFPDTEKAHYEAMLINSMRTHELGDAYNKLKIDMNAGEKAMTEYIHKNEDRIQMDKLVPGWNKDSQLKLKMLPFKKIEGLPAPKWMEKLHKEGILSDGQYDRASYAVEEMERTDRFIDLTKNPKMIENPIEMLTEMGKLINETHIGLSKKLRVSTPELEKIVDTITSLPGCYGARLMGGGFGGCVIAIVDTKKFNEDCRKKLIESFKNEFPDLGECIIYESGIGKGAFTERKNSI